MESKAVILHKSWRPQPTVPCFGLQYSFSKKSRTTVLFSSMQGSSPSLRFVKQAWRNPKEGRVGCLHQSDWYRIYLRLLQQLFMSRVPCVPVFDVPASSFHTSPRPILDVLKSLVSRPQVPSPHTRVPMWGPASGGSHVARLNFKTSRVGVY